MGNGKTYIKECIENDTKDTYADNDNISNGLFNQILSAGAFGSGKIK